MLLSANGFSNRRKFHVFVVGYICLKLDPPEVYQLAPEKLPGPNGKGSSSNQPKPDMVTLALDIHKVFGW